ncbi:MAG: SGNH/GDSL hydrolase family protein [Actinomycetota bacterium]
MSTKRHARLFGAVTAVAVSVAGAALAGGPASAAEASPPVQVLTIGDSIMNGFGLPQGEDWPSLLGEAENWSVTNAACDGAGVLQVGNANECDSDFAGIIDANSSLEPDLVIFEGSSNDFGLSNSELLTATISELQTIKADFPGAEIVGFSTLWGYTDPPAQLADIDSQVQQAVEQVGGTYIDIGQPFSGHPELMQASDVHPTAAGQAILASAIQADLQPVVVALDKARAASSNVVPLGVLERLHAS